MVNSLLDTNVLILALRGYPKALDLLAETNTQFFISVVTRAEIFAGMRPHEELRTIALLDSLSSLPIDNAIADQAGRLVYDYARQGIQLSFADTLIAATVLRHDLTLITTNVKHFPMPKLKLQPLE